MRRSDASSLSIRKLESAGAPLNCSISRSTLHARVAAGGIQGDRELGDVAPLECADLADALLPDLVDANDRMQRQVAALDPGKLGLDALLGRVEDHAAALAEHQFLDLDEDRKSTRLNSSH